MGSQKELGKNLKKLREKAGLTQAEVAEGAAINTNFYARVERGEEKVSLDTLEAIAKVLKTKVAEIIPF